ncbi:hypothetical protein UY3_05360 [Chelonia mydas]|uniref:Uncharacterized protein n=1 Tax=Chelonia mydas TaxID=8469 RepID=M7BHS8_CHEMY|nr:hypothetical protein UY3_05360 [Chelonia mydas]
MANYQALLARYDVNNYARLTVFQDKLSSVDRAQFFSLLEEVRLVVKTVLQDAVEVTDTASGSLATGIVMRRDSWLQSSGFPRGVQNISQDLPWDESNFFNEKSDDSLHSLKDSRCTRLCLRIYTSAPRRKYQRQTYKPRPLLPPYACYYERPAEPPHT